MNRAEFDTCIDCILQSAENLIPKENLPDLPYMELAPTVPDWYEFEHKLWSKGEDIRQLVLSEHKDLNTNQADRVCKICMDFKAKRGRQSFVLLLAKKRFLSYAAQLGTLLPDHDIDGHIIAALYKMKAFQFSELIKPYTNHSITWIRNEAKRYIEKCKTLDITSSI